MEETSQPRRSPAPAFRRRDAERTRRALLDAALIEFSAKGRAGARVSDIAERAGVDKQLISYYFDGKDGLYRALIERWVDAERELTTPDLPLADLVAGYATEAAGNRDLARLLVRESIEDQATDPDPTVSEAIADLRRRQQAGEISSELDPACLLLLFQAAAAVSVTFPGDVRQATGLDPASPEFTDIYAQQLRRVVRHLAESPPRD